MTHPLDSCRAKLDRASTNLDVLSETILTHLENASYRCETKFKFIEGEDIGVAIVRAYFTTPHPVANLAAIIGEIVHNLRSALDHLAWQLCIVAGNKPQEGRTEFPIFIDPPKYVTDAPRKIACMDPIDQARVEYVQPYHGGDLRWLWVLQELSNTDKHR